MARKLGDLLDARSALLPRRDEPEIAARIEVINRQIADVQDIFFGLDMTPAGVARRLRFTVGDPDGERDAG